MVMPEESPQAVPAKASEAEPTPQPAQDYEVHLRVSAEMRPLLKDGPPPLVLRDTTGHVGD